MGIEGVGRLMFDGDGGAPSSYTGEYAEIQSDQKLAFEGFRLNGRNESHRQLLGELNKSVEAKKRAMERFFETEYPAYVTASDERAMHLVDWPATAQQTNREPTLRSRGVRT